MYVYKVNSDLYTCKTLTNLRRLNTSTHLKWCMYGYRKYRGVNWIRYIPRPNLIYDHFRYCVHV